MRSCESSAHRQRGASLITALIFLAVISMLSITSMRGSRIGVRMAQNEESRIAAHEVAQGLTELIAGAPAATPVIGGAGFTICTAGEAGCNMYTINIPAGYIADEVAAGHLSARVERMDAPDRPPPRLTGSSLDKFSAAAFEVTATFDRSDAGLGRAQLNEGVLVLVPR